MKDQMYSMISLEVKFTMICPHSGPACFSQIRKSVVYCCTNVEELVSCHASSKPITQEQTVVVNGLQ
jgi:hypothetical protein